MEVKHAPVRAVLKALGYKGESVTLYDDDIPKLNLAIDAELALAHAERDEYADRLQVVEGERAMLARRLAEYEGSDFQRDQKAADLMKGYGATPGQVQALIHGRHVGKSYATTWQQQQVQASGPVPSWSYEAATHTVAMRVDADALTDFRSLVTHYPLDPSAICNWLQSQGVNRTAHYFSDIQAAFKRTFGM